MLFWRKHNSRSEKKSKSPCSDGSTVLTSFSSKERRSCRTKAKFSLQPGASFISIEGKKHLNSDLKCRRQRPSQPVSVRSEEKYGCLYPVSTKSMSERVCTRPSTLTVRTSRRQLSVRSSSGQLKHHLKRSQTKTKRWRLPKCVRRFRLRCRVIAYKTLMRIETTIHYLLGYDPMATFLPLILFLFFASGGDWHVLRAIPFVIILKMVTIAFKWFRHAAGSPQFNFMWFSLQKLCQRKSSKDIGMLKLDTGKRRNTAVQELAIAPTALSLTRSRSDRVFNSFSERSKVLGKTSILSLRERFDYLEGQ